MNEAFFLLGRPMIVEQPTCVGPSNPSANRRLLGVDRIALFLKGCGKAAHATRRAYSAARNCAHVLLVTQIAQHAAFGQSGSTSIHPDIRGRPPADRDFDSRDDR